MKWTKKSISLLLVAALVVSSLTLGFGRITPQAISQSPDQVGYFKVEIKTKDSGFLTGYGTDDNCYIDFYYTDNPTVCAISHYTDDINDSDDFEQGDTNTCYLTNDNTATRAKADVPAKPIDHVVFRDKDGSDDWTVDWAKLYYSPDGGTSWYVIAQITSSHKYTDANESVTFTYPDAYSLNTSSLNKTITFSGNGGTIGGNSSSQVYSEYGATLSPTIFPNINGSACSRTGYVFSHWHANGADISSWPTYGPSTDITYEAQWTANSYYVAYNPNNGAGGQMEPSLYAYGIAKNLSTNIYTRIGYTFAGWSLTEDGPLAYTDGQSVSDLSPIDKNIVVLYAKWIPISYTITYDGNGSTNGTTPNSSHNYDVESPLSVNAFVRTGYSFAGWSTSSDGAVNYDDGQNVTNLSSTQDEVVTLYANWSPYSYSVLYDPNGGSGSTTPSYHTYDVDSALTPNGFFKTGYTFIGWAASPSGNVLYSNNDYVLNLSSINGDAVTLYAKWLPISYTISYNANGTNVNGLTANSSHQYDAAKNLTANGFSRLGYVFSGWNTAANGSGTTYTNGQNVVNLTTANRSTINFYAMWTANQYKITFDANGGSGGTGPTYMAYDSPLVAPTVTKLGYTFVKWLPDVPTTVPLGDTIYTAQWVISTQTVSFDLNGGTGTVPVSQSGQQGKVVTLPPKGNIDKPYYTFLGWALSPTATEALTIYSIPSENVTLYAVWSLNKYRITFDANGGSGGTGPTLMYYDSPLTIPTVTREGYTFLEWSPEVPSKVPGQDTIYTALWSSNITVSFNLNGGTGTIPASQSHLQGTTVMLPSKGDIEKQGYTFKGWALSPTATEALESYSMPGENTTLYAVWSINGYWISFNANGGNGGTEPALMMYDSPLTAPTVTREGYTFTGWLPEASSKVPAQDTIYMAQWSKNITVSYDLNGGTGTIPASQSSPEGTTVLLPANIDFAKQHYTFKGWALSASATEGLDSYLIPNEDTTLYAVWVINKYLISFDANGGSGGTEPTLMAYDSTLDIPTVAKEGYTLVGWLPQVPEKVPEQDTTYIAQWSKNITVSYNLNGGLGTIPVSQSNPEGTAVVLPAKGDIENQGYTFMGWALTDNATTALTSYSIPSEDVTLYAVWSVNQYKINFDANGGNGGTEPTDMTFGSSLAIPTVTKDGYTLTGWLPEVPSTVPAKDTTYVAQWSKNITVSFDLNGGTGTIPAYQSNPEGTAVTLPQKGDIEKQNYDFLGWALTPNATEAILSYSIPSADVTLYAVWCEIPTIISKAESTAKFDRNNHIIYGLEQGITAEIFASNYVTINGNGELLITPSAKGFGSGTKVELIDKVTNEVLETFYIVIFGDVDGDGYVTAEDVNQVSLVSSYQTVIDENSAIWYAADLTRDGIVDSFDLNIIRAASNGIGTINQKVL